LRRDRKKDDVVSFDDVILPAGRRADVLWREQQLRWPMREVEASPHRVLVAAAS
jgi:hypothetical protein